MYNIINNKKDISPKIKIRKRKSQKFLFIFNESKINKFINY